METQNVYLGSDNVLDLYLASDGVALTAGQMASITRIRIAFGDVTIYSDNQSGDPIRWAQGGWRDGEMQFTLGHRRIEPGFYQAVIAIHHAGATRGVTWGRAPFQVWSELENDVIIWGVPARVTVVGYAATVTVS